MYKYLGIIVGVLLIPTIAFAYTIQSGDTLWGLYGSNWKSVAQSNGIANPTNLQIGSVINEEPMLGATIPVVVALYEDALATKLNNTATSTFTLVRGTDKQSRSLSGTYGFVIDEGTSVEEFFTATCVGTTCTIITRGIDVVDGETNVSGNQHEHRRGAVVKISNYPQLSILSRILNGNEGVPNLIYYDTNISFVSASSSAIITKQYADNLTAQGVATSTESTFGGGTLATQTQMASSTYSADNPRLIYSRYTTSSPDVRGLYIPVAQNNGYLASGWGGTADSLATLDSNTLVVQNPANAVVTSSVNKIPKGNNTDGRLDERWGKFGGDGSDGALNITTGTTTINISSATTLIKEYTSININAGGGLAFSNSASAGSVIILRSQGDCTIGGIVDASGLGANGSAGGAGGADGVGAAGTAGISASGFIFDAVEHAGAAGSGGAVSVVVAAGGSATPVYPGKLFYRQQGFHQMIVAPGSGGGGGGGGGESAGGGGGTGGAGGAGGKGGGGIIIECAGTYNATGTIMATGVDGTDGGAEASSDESGGGGGGGGGAGGDIFVLYNLSDTDTATYTVTGGAASTGGAGSGDATGDATGGGGGAGGSNSTGAGTSGTASAGTPGSAGGVGGAGANGTATREENLTFF